MRGFGRSGGDRSGELYLGGGGLPDPNNPKRSVEVGESSPEEPSDEYDSSDIISSSLSGRPLSMS